MKEILLTRGKVAIVDDEDYALVNRMKWQAAPSRDTFYAMCGIPGLRGQQRLLMHRLIMDPPKGMEIDHINGNGLDNRRANMRIVTRQQNLQNRRGWGKYGKWVSFDPKRQQFRVAFSCFCATQEEAQALANKLALLAYGDHSNTGHMTSPESVIPEIPTVAASAQFAMLFDCPPPLEGVRT
jgi:hypothetical protein